ncbi:chemotaxis protein [Peribacillus alkalitolerans]|uniref:chemotaxis protein n=1 Tax=Peribacillus alkalitolerans TaxID=1550385 RepID=UPI0013D3C8B5|nr:chemotaxis protein [Peribacillus alkalitolerans]
MEKKIAVAIVHGMGNQTEEFAKDGIKLIKREFDRKLEGIIANPSSYLIIQPIFWAEIFAEKEEQLFRKLHSNNNLNFHNLRKFVIHYLGDAVAYQPVETDQHNYGRVHKKIADGLQSLSMKAGEHAPLCVISHSLGSVVASNYFYDLQYKGQVGGSLSRDHSPIELGKTLTLFYTLGTTLPLWSLRYHNFDRPIDIPSQNLSEYYPGLNGEWINFFDKDDILGYPLREVDKNYKNAVNKDIEVNVGGILTNWNPLAHSAYLTDEKVIETIVKGLVRTWRQINNL